MITITENQDDVFSITISVPSSKANELGQLVDKLTAFVGNVNLTGVKKAPAKVKKLTRDERRERNRKNLRGIK